MINRPTIHPKIKKKKFTNSIKKKRVRKKREDKMSTGGGLGRPVPYLKIIHQPSSVYRMRYKKENRATFLYAQDAILPTSSLSSSSSSSSISTMTANQTSSTNPANKKPVRKKGGGAITNQLPDGTFPKVEVTILFDIRIQNNSIQNNYLAITLRFFLLVVFLFIQSEFF